MRKKEKSKYSSNYFFKATTIHFGVNVTIAIFAIFYQYLAVKIGVFLQRQNYVISLFVKN
jgi:hypothetical protein